MVLFFVCIALTVYNHTEVECCMSQTKGNTTLLEAQQSTFWTLSWKLRYLWIMSDFAYS